MFLRPGAHFLSLLLLLASLIVATLTEPTPGVKEGDSCRVQSYKHVVAYCVDDDPFSYIICTITEKTGSIRTGHYKAEFVKSPCGLRYVLFHYCTIVVAHMARFRVASFRAAPTPRECRQTFKKGYRADYPPDTPPYWIILQCDEEWIIDSPNFDEPSLITHAPGSFRTSHDRQRSKKLQVAETAVKKNIRAKSMKNTVPKAPGLSGPIVASFGGHFTSPQASAQQPGTHSRSASPTSSEDWLEAGLAEYEAKQGSTSMSRRGLSTAGSDDGGDRLVSRGRSPKKRMVRRHRQSDEPAPATLK